MMTARDEARARKLLHLCTLDEATLRAGSAYRLNLAAECRRAGPGGKFWTRNQWVPGKPVPPKASDVLSSLLMDASGTEQTFEDWCGDFGEDTDSRRALELYLLLQENAKKLAKLLRMSAMHAVETFGAGDAELAADVLTGREVFVVLPEVKS